MSDLNTQFRIAVAQFNPLLGDIARNTDKIIAQAQEALVERGCDLILFPELALTGYPPEDLLLRPEYHERVTQALETLCAARLPGILILGHPSVEGNQIYNSASVIQDGTVIHRYDKQRLPNFSVFDEKRYFTRGHRSPVLNLAGRLFALAICEDIWHPGHISKAAKQGVEGILCLNASPYERQKHRQRLNILRTRQEQEAKLPIVYANLCGGQDELIFDGGSFVLNSAGEVCQQAEFFQPGLFDFEWSERKAKKVSAPDDCEQNYQALVLGTRDYINKNNFPTAIIGLSGGIDSALTLTIAVDAIGAERVHAFMLPSRYTAPQSIKDAKQICDNLSVDYQEISIEPAFDALSQSLAPYFSDLPLDATEENLQARCRGVILMALSNKFNHLVLTTGNKSELAVGYSTLYGDMAGGFAVLKDCLKTQVYQLAAFRNAQSPVIPQSIIERAPSAELRADQRDQDSLPEYHLLDNIITRYVVEDQSAQQIIDSGVDSEVVYEVLRMIQRSEYKRWQSPPGIRISSRAFGRDWRYPVTTGFGSTNEKN